MTNFARILAWLLTAALLPAHACEQTEQADQIDIADQISSIIYSDRTKSDMLDQLSSFVRVGDELDEFHATTKLSYFFCMGGGPGVVDCKFDNGLQLVADPDGKIQVIRRRERVVDGKTYKDMSISTHLLIWDGYVRGYPE